MANIKYFTEEERKEAKRAKIRKWRAKHKQEIAEYNAKYHEEHRTEILERKIKHYQEHRDEILEHHAIYNKEHKKEKAEYDARYRQTKEGRASNLINAHKREDKKYNRGNCDLTVPWFVRNIYTKCIYCGETDWKKLGCDRIDNNLPHTMENVVPCCLDCNNKRKLKPFEQFYWESKHETLGEES